MAPLNALPVPYPRRLTTLLSTLLAVSLLLLVLGGAAPGPLQGGATSAGVGGAAAMPTFGQCLDNCVQCKMQMGRHFSADKCALNCKLSEGFSPDCLNYDSVKAFLI